MAVSLRTCTSSNTHTHTHIAPNANSEILAAKYKDKASLQMETWEKREHKAKQKQMLVCDSDNKLYPH